MTSQRTFHRVPIRQTALALIGELGSESNAHGVARIVQSRDSRRKVLWSLLVLLGVGAAISQLSSLVHKYLQYQVGQRGLADILIWRILCSFTFQFINISVLPRTIS